MHILPRLIFAQVDIRLSSTDALTDEQSFSPQCLILTSVSVQENITEPLHASTSSCQVLFHSEVPRRIGLATFSATLSAQYVYKIAQSYEALNF
jgi:hypothetical protein